MQDAALFWGNDYVASPIGDIGLVDSTLLGQQRVLRRLLTNPGDYVWQPEYGAGLGRFIGAPLDVRAVTSAIRSEIFKEVAVSRLPEPVVEASQDLDGTLFINIRYADATSGDTQVLAFSMGA